MLEELKKHLDLLKFSILTNGKYINTKTQIKICKQWESNNNLFEQIMQEQVSNQKNNNEPSMS